MKKTKQISLFGDCDNVVPAETHAKAVNTTDPSPVAYNLKELSFDIEATGSNPLSDTVVGISLCKEKGKAYYLPIRHEHGHNMPEALNMLKAVLEDECVAKMGHNLKYDILILRKEDIHVKGRLYDTMIASYLLNPNKPDHSLEDTGLDHISFKKRAFTEVLGKRHSFAELEPEEALQYAAEDAELAFELKEILFEKLKAESLEDLYFKIEMPLIYVLADIEEAGVKIDSARLHELSGILDGELGLIESGIYEYAGGRFNINSPKQLAKVLFDDLKLQPGKKTKTGYSTNVEVLESLAKTHELPREILNYRSLYKLKNTYVDALPRLVNARTGRVHTSFNQTVTATGRLSSSEPNLQNIPVRGDWGIRIREAFIAEDGHSLISADYSQIELRILAHMSGDKVLIDAFKRNIDVHSITAAEIFGVALEEVTTDMRRIAKTVNFGVVYGMSPYGLSEALNISPKEASQYIDQYFQRHTGVTNFINETIMAARQDGFVTTLLARKRPVPEISSANGSVRQQTERLATNTPLQGTAADLIKIAMINISDRFKREKIRTRMVLQIHDELLFEAPENEIKDVIEIIRYEMENALVLDVPLKVEIGQGKNWAEAH